MEKFQIPCPTVVALKKHVLVMSFIGENRVPAPTLKDAKLSTVDIQIAYEQCLQVIFNFLCLRTLNYIFEFDCQWLTMVAVVGDCGIQESRCSVVKTNYIQWVGCVISSLWVSCTGSASDWCALQEELYKCIDTIQYRVVHVYCDF